MRYGFIAGVLLLSACKTATLPTSGVQGVFKNSDLFVYREMNLIDVKSDLKRPPTKVAAIDFAVQNGNDSTPMYILKDKTINDLLGDRSPLYSKLHSVGFNDNFGGRPSRDVMGNPHVYASSISISVERDEELSSSVLHSDYFKCIVKGRITVYADGITNTDKNLGSYAVDNTAISSQYNQDVISEANFKTEFVNTCRNAIQVGVKKAMETIDFL